MCMYCFNCKFILMGKKNSYTNKNTLFHIAPFLAKLQSALHNRNKTTYGRLNNNNRKIS